MDNPLTKQKQLIFKNQSICTNTCRVMNPCLKQTFLTNLVREYTFKKFSEENLPANININSSF